MPDGLCQPAAQQADTVVRRVWRITGQVQGVGFRPFVYRLATELRLSGTVRNDAAGVTVDAWGPAEAIAQFQKRVRSDAPALACVASVVCLHELSDPGERVPFRIIESDHDRLARGRVTVDSAVCPDCLRELLDPGDRRHRHALINCTNCGPRYTIVRDLPYDRPLTTMAGFPMCPSCEREYTDPADRRFHAQPTCCPSCGPTLTLMDARGRRVACDPITQAAALLRQGKIVAIKGLGGYHLAVDALSSEAVDRLRLRKKRDHKPFAVMMADVETAKRFVVLSREAEALLCSPICPIILADRRDDAVIADGVAPANHRLGIMVPYTPIQHLLFAEGLGPLVMTSANLSDEPLVKDDREATERLSGICDAYLAHDRPIERAVDDSVVLDGPRGLLPIRRARGYVPSPITMPVAASRPGLCVGADLKNTVAIVRNDEVIVSHHLGDLSHSRGYEWFVRTIADLKRLYDVAPTWVACDLHPTYLSRRYAKRLASEAGLDLIGVQHHHAHLGSLLAEHSRVGPIIGIVCDGVGYGDDGEAWGGEIFIGDLTGYQRVGRLRPLRLPGGDAAAKQTGRCAISWLFDVFGDDAIDHQAAAGVLADRDERAAMLGLLHGSLNCPASSGLGRLFDAAAALLGVCDYNHHEAMSGMMLESAAARAGERPTGDDIIRIEAGEPFELDQRPLLGELIERMRRGEPTENIAWLFHDAVAAGLAAAALRAVETAGLHTVGLTGGVFCNALLTERVAERLERAGCEVLTHHAVPATDGGISLGQAAIAAACLQRKER
ncbi:MAG: carbamoyltransferase HypF [Phycisphaerales bacterium]|nr:carbamoyltransferase HypF [Phycisphaerales bacterium]